MRIVFSLLIILQLSINIQGQQSAQYSQYMLDKYQFNPAYGGMERSLNINVALRAQWSGLPGSPKSQYVSAHMPFYIWNGSIGMTINNETAGVLRNLSITGSYNYVYVSPIGLFSLGTSFGFMQKSINGNEIITPDGIYIDNQYTHNDPTLLSGDYNGIAPTWTFGGFLKNKSYNLGISISNIPAPNLKAAGSKFKIGTVSTLYADYIYPYNNEWDISPSVLIKSDFIETQTDISLMGTYTGKLFGSIGIRGYNSNSLDAIVIMAGTKLSDNYSISYSFDTGLSSIKRYNEGSHEIRLIYNLNRPIATGLPPKIIYNPRFL